MKVGIFDSGLGGLTVAKSILEIIKGAQIFYIADTAYAPYGDKTSQQILNRCDEITDYLIKNQNIDALVVACNTATSAAIVHLRQKYKELIIIGTEPALKPAFDMSKNHKVAVLATKVTLNGEKYKLLVQRLQRNRDVEVFSCACVGLVEQIEDNQIHSKKTLEMLKSWLEPMKKAKVDIIVLGCTHYPILSEVIGNIMGEDVSLVHSGGAIAKRLLDLSLENGHINSGNVEFEVYYTGKIEENMVKNILDNDIKIRKCEI